MSKKRRDTLELEPIDENLLEEDEEQEYVWEEEEETSGEEYYEDDDFEEESDESSGYPWEEDAYEYQENPYIYEEQDEEEYENPLREKRLKKRKRKKRRKKLILPVLLILLAIGAGLVFFAHSDYFSVDRIKIENNEYYTAGQIREMAGIQKGVNLFFDVDKSRMEKALEKDPYIEEAKISRKLPDTLVISVRERNETAAVGYNKKYYVIDSTGYVVNVTDKRPDITRIYNLHVTSGKVGEALSVKENGQLTKTLKLLNTASSSTVSFTRIFVYQKTVKAYVYRKLYIRGKTSDIEDCIKSGKMEAVLYDLYEKGVKHGMVRVGSDQYCVYNPDAD